MALYFKHCTISFTLYDYTILLRTLISYCLQVFDIQVQDTEKSKSTEVEEYELIIKETRKLIEVFKPHMTVSEVLLKAI